MKKISMLLVLSFLLIIIVACSNDSNGDGGAGEDENVELTMTAYGNPQEQEIYQKAVDAYMEENPHVSVELIPAPGDTYRQQLFTQLQGSQAPDLFYVGAEYMGQLAQTDRLVELGEFLELEDSYVQKDEFAEGLWGDAQQEDGLYGVPVDSNPMLIYYNKNVLEESGIDPNEPQKLYEAGEWDWENFQQLNEQVTEAGNYGFVAENGQLHYYSWMWSNGGRVYDEEDNMILGENQEAQEALGYIADNIADGNFTYAGSLPEGQGPDAMFMSNQTAFIAAGRWLTPMFSDNDSFDFDYIPWPTNTGEELEMGGIAAAYMAIGEHSDNVEEAQKFLSYYVSEQGQRDRLEEGGNAVPSVTTADDIIEGVEVPEHSNYLLDVRDVGVVERTVVPGLDEQINDTLDLLFLGQEDLDTTVEQIDQIGKEMIAEYQNGE
ncbi:ABC transporter substrate-binding protein [Gracilibacillus timonensis]|uniref:ABC transporter substrate-binding protein n=1 Tax=Gracilibacillus timonensis TaxID=1816696 RepID=UPI000825CA35|nr:sugar ABC transporter substrate-binding protein [Gracilibacillus timonensis]